MSDPTTENFWKAMAEFVPPAPKPVFFRLYYNDDGTPIKYSMDEEPHLFVEVDSSAFWAGNMNVRVVDGQLVFPKPVVTVNKLQPADHGTACNPKDVCVVVSEDQPNIKWTLSSNEIN